MKNNRYIKQIILPEIGKEGQILINNSKILCIGAGGLGVPILNYLAAAGVGTIGIVDGDTINESNLQRQTAYHTNHIGLLKVDKISSHLEKLNPYIKINKYPFFLSHENAFDIFKAYDLILDGTDNFHTKYLINDISIKLNKPLIYGSVFGFEGQVSVFWPSKDGPCYRCIYPNSDINNNSMYNCNIIGTLGPVVGIIGSIQALEAIKIILNKYSLEKKNLSILFKKILVIDCRSMNTYLLDTIGNMNCTSCKGTISKVSVIVDKERINKTFKKQEIIARSNDSSSIYKESYEIDYFTYIELNKSKKMFIFIDIREDQEIYLNGKIQNSIQIPFSIIEKNFNIILNYVNHSNSYIIYCQHGIRSSSLLKILISKGFLNIFHLKGGISEWKGPLIY